MFFGPPPFVRMFVFLSLGAALAGCPGPTAGVDAGSGDAGDTRPSVRVLNLSARSITIIDSVTGAPIAMLAADNVVTDRIAVAPGAHTFSDLSGALAPVDVTVDSGGALIIVSDVLQAVPRRSSDADRTLVRTACAIAGGCMLEPAVAGASVIEMGAASMDLALTSAGYRIVGRRTDPRRFRLATVGPTEILVVSWDVAIVVPREGLLEYRPFDAELQVITELGTPPVDVTAYFGADEIAEGAHAAPVGVVDVFFGSGPRPATAPDLSVDVAGLGPGELGVLAVVARGTTIDSTLVVVPNAPPGDGVYLVVGHALPGGAPVTAFTRATCGGAWMNAGTAAFGESTEPFEVSGCGIGAGAAGATGPTLTYAGAATTYRMGLGLLVPDPESDAIAEPAFLHVLTVGVGELTDSGYFASVPVP